MKLFYSSIIGIGLLFFCGGVEARAQQKPVTIAVGEMPFLFSAINAEKGAYNRLMEKVEASLGRAFKLFYLPPGRAGQEFEKKSFDCLMPGQIANMAEQQKRIASVPFHYAIAYVFNSSAQPPITTMQSLQGKVLATRRGFVYGNLVLDEKITTVKVNHIQQSIDMLNKERIDAFVAYEPDILTILANTPDHNVHRGNLVIHKQPETIVCHRSSRINTFIQRFDALIESMRSSGELEKVLAHQ